jgi:hypothetical protein
VPIRDPVLEEPHHPAVIDRVAGRDGPCGGSLCGASLDLALSRQCPHRSGMAACARPPYRTRRADFPHRAPTDRIRPISLVTPSGAAFSGTAARTTLGF